MQKISSFHLFILEIQAILESRHKIGHTHSWPSSTRKFQINPCEFVSTWKKLGRLMNLFQQNSWFKNHAIWLAKSISAYISVTRFLPNIGFVQQHNINAHYRTNSVKIITQIFYKFKKPCFWPIFPIFRAKNVFQEKTNSVLHNLIRDKIQKNLMIHFQENTQTGGRTERWANPISLNLSNYCRGSTKYNCSRMAFKKSQI